MWIQRLQVVRFPQELQTPEESGSNPIRYPSFPRKKYSHSPIHYSPGQSNRRRSHWNWSSGTSTTNNARHSGQVSPSHSL